jgi:cyanophycinase
MLFLHGGGDARHARNTTFGRFVQAATAGGSCRLAVVVAEETEAQAQASFEDYRAIFAALPNGPTVIHPVLVSATQPLTPAQLEPLEPTGLFVCGGSTPLYQQALCENTSWLAYLRTAKIPYGGTSAGAAIAARTAIVGGWQATRMQETRAILFQGASEGLDSLSVRNGLGLVPFAVEIHASQMGTLTRLLHAVELGMVAEGWAIDENTLIQIDADAMQIYGLGHAYHVWRDHNQPVRVTIHTAELRTKLFVVQ